MILGANVVDESTETVLCDLALGAPWRSARNC